MITTDLDQKYSTICSLYYCTLNPISKNRFLQVVQDVTHLCEYLEHTHAKSQQPQYRSRDVEQCGKTLRRIYSQNKSRELQTAILEGLDAIIDSSRDIKNIE